jgi:hypothetical protein
MEQGGAMPHTDVRFSETDGGLYTGAAVICARVLSNLRWVAPRQRPPGVRYG